MLELSVSDMVGEDGIAGAAVEAAVTGLSPSVALAERERLVAAFGSGRGKNSTASSEERVSSLHLLPSFA